MYLIILNNFRNYRALTIGNFVFVLILLTENTLYHYNKHETIVSYVMFRNK